MHNSDRDALSTARNTFCPYLVDTKKKFENFELVTMVTVAVLHQ